MSGSLPTELGNLSNLTYLSLGSNSLSGSLPTELGNLSNLTYLSLGSNSLSGSIPSELGNLSNLTGLSLGSNNLSGSIPSELGNLVKLTRLALGSNELSGSIPGELGNLVELTILSLDRNELSGSLPATLGNLDKLESLRLAVNRLSGPIPSELGNLDSVKILYLHSNSLSGSIPSTLGNLDTLETLWIRFNNLSGSIPSELGNLSNLTSFYLKGNSLSGCVPDGLSGVTDSDMYQANLHFCSDTPPPAPADPQDATADRDALVALYNATGGANWTNNDNWLSAEPISTWHGVTTDENDRVTEVSLFSNNLVGTIPDLNALTQLWTLSLSDNQLSGPIPDLSALNRLYTLNLYDNQLSGPLLDLSALNNLGLLQLQDNQLSGPIEGLHHLTTMSTLNLAGNSFCLPAAFDRAAIRNTNVLAALDSLSLPTCTDDQSAVAPGVPQNLTTSVAGSQVAVAWDAVTNAASYDLWVWDSADQLWASASETLTTTSHTHTALTDGRSYYFRVRARDASDNRGAWSEEVAAVVSGSQFPAPPPHLGLSSFDKYAEAGGVGVITAWHTPDSYLIRAQGVITGMFKSRPNLLAQLAAERTAVSIEPGIRGLAQKYAFGWTAHTPQHDPYCHTMVHEIAHLVHYLLEDDPFDPRLLAMYEDALDAGLWIDSYSATNHWEYFGQGVSFQLTDSYQNRYNSSTTLAEYDADLAALVDEIFGATTMPTTCGPDW